MNWLRLRNMTQRTCALASFKEKYQCPEAGAREVGNFARYPGQRQALLQRLANQPVKCR